MGLKDLLKHSQKQRNKKIEVDKDHIKEHLEDYQQIYLDTFASKQ